MHPLPAHTVDLLLDLISPLSAPLPPHLISTSLQQLHHFLQIPPSSPVEYLCWPSPDSAKITDLLDRLPLSSDRANFQTRYTSDSESTFAHVQISSDAQGLRMLFHWDAADGWKYHDLRLMPFPSPSYLTPQESLASSSTADFSPLTSTEVDQINDGDDDNSYWDAYGAAGHDLISPVLPQNSTDTVEGEDAYWAQYASVQGSADSTVPSPLPTHRKLQLANITDDESAFPFPSQNNPIICDIPVNAIHSRLHASREEPPSPNTLARLLSMISPRNETYSPALGDPYSLRSPVLTPERTTMESELVTPPLPNGYLDASDVSPVTLKLNGVPLSQCPSPLQAEDTALADSIRGLYFLWKAGRKGEPDDKDQSVFLRIVQAAITHD